MNTKDDNTGTRHPARSLAAPPTEGFGPIPMPGFPGELHEPVLQLNFHGAPLETVLNYLRLTAGFIVRVRPNVDVTWPVDMFSDRPVTREGAVELLNQALNFQGCIAIQNGRELTIIRSRDTKKNYIRIPLPEISGPHSEVTF